MHFLKTWIKYLFRLPANAVVASSSNLRYQIDSRLRTTDALHENPALTAKFYPAAPEREVFSLSVGTEDVLHVDRETLPIPPVRLMEGYGPSTDRYLGTAKAHFETLKQELEATGFSLAPKSIAGLDFGCAAGRWIRCFEPYAKPGQFFGVDVSSEHIAWCQTHLSPPFSFLTTTTFPHLPFSDSQFDLIYSGSVFTHISDLADMWLLELARILKPEGRIYITLHDRHTVERLRTHYPEARLTEVANELDAETSFMTRPFTMVAHRRSAKDAMVFYDEEYLKSHWGQFLKVHRYTHEAYGVQSAIVLGKSS